MVDRIIEIENHRLQEYEGNYSAYVHAKQSRLKMLERQFAHEEELLAYEQAASAARREAARNPSNAIARRLADIKKRQAPRPIDQIIVTGLAKGFNGTPLFEGLSFDLQRGDRVAVLGSNGSGKSTLLDVLTGETDALGEERQVRLVQPGLRRAGSR